MAGHEARFVPIRHDAAVKAILGHAGAFVADGLAALLLEHPATSRRLAWRLCHEFLDEGAVESEALDALAEGPRAHGLAVGWGVATVSRSQLSFDAAGLGRRDASAPEFAVGTVRALEMFDPAPSMPVLADWCGRPARDLFDARNVGGWPGGRAWITTRSAIGRANLAAGPFGDRDRRPRAARDPCPPVALPGRRNSAKPAETGDQEPFAATPREGQGEGPEGQETATKKPRDGPEASGGGGIRTPGTLAGPAVFKTAAFDHSATPPETDMRGAPQAY